MKEFKNTFTAVIQKVQEDYKDYDDVLLNTLELTINELINRGWEMNCVEYPVNTITVNEERKEIEFDYLDKFEKKNKISNLFFKELE